LIGGNFLTSHLQQFSSNSYNNSKFCPYSTMVNLAMVAILLFTIPVNQDASWLSSGLMQNSYYGTYTLKVGSSSFM